MHRIGRLHLLTDTSLQTRFTHAELAALAIEGGADVVQYRTKNASTRLMIREATAMKEICRKKGVPLLVNDRVDVALAADADGAHVGEEDLPIPLARRLLGLDRLIGGSAVDVEGARRCAEEGADYAGVGPIFPTSSKSDAGPVLGLEGLARAVRETAVPVIAIGGIAEENLESVLATGVRGVAVISAFCLAENPARAAERLRRIIDRMCPTA